MEKMIYTLTMMRSRKTLEQKYGKKFWVAFKNSSKQKLDAILPLTLDIGGSIFSMNFKFGPPYIAWYQALIEIGIQQQECWEIIWLMNEKLVTTAPRFLLHLSGKTYFGGMKEKAATHIERQKCNALHPYDWEIAYREISANTFEMDITECGLKKLAHEFGADGLLPGICRLDYMLSHLMGNGFERTKTLGDGDDCCNGRYHIVGSCEWSPEKGFLERK
jgi:hypothetical protein